MITKGQVLYNPVTGEELRFVETAADTNGAYTLVECTVRPEGFVAAAHVHPAQTETFEIVSGTVCFRLGRQTLEATAGDTVIVVPGRPHQFWNAGEDDAVFRCKVEPALRFERLIETMFGLAAAGKTNRKGMPNPLRLAVIANAHFGDVRLPFPPAWMQRMGLLMGAPVGRLLGYSAAYDGETAEPALAL